VSGLDEREGGSFANNTITIQLSALRHELQHFLQRRETFAYGANPGTEGLEKLAERVEQNRRRISELTGLLQTHPKNAPDYHSLEGERNKLISVVICFQIFM